MAMDGKRAKLLCAAFFILGAGWALIVVLLGGAPLMERLHVRALTAGVPAVSGLPQFEKAGPWGKIEAVEIPFASPDGVFPDRDERLQQPKWVFEGTGQASLIRFFNSCDLRGYERRLLLDKRAWKITANSCEITPS